MFNKLVIVMLVIITLVFSVPQSTHADSWPFTAQVCRTGENYYLKIQVEESSVTSVSGEIIRRLAQHVGYNLAWAPDNHWIWEDVWVWVGQPVEIPLDVSDALPNTLTVWHMDYGTFILEFPLDDTTPQCHVESAPLPCDPSVAENAALVAFVTDTELLWLPDSVAGTGQWVKSGQTAWMTDYKDGYLQVVWSCESLWVNSNSIVWAE